MPKKTSEPKRKRTYRIPFEIRKGERYFPTMPVLFQFIRKWIADVYDTEEEHLSDGSVVRFIYQHFPYAHQFKLGLKNISHVGYITFLARHTGLPLSFIQKIRTGEWDLERAWEEYITFKKSNKVHLVTELVGPKGMIEIDLESKIENATLASKAYGFLVYHLRHLLCPPNRPEVY